MKKNLTKNFLFFLILALPACSTIKYGMNQEITIRCMDSKSYHLVEGANCTLTNQAGNKYLVQKTPAIVKVDRGRGDIYALCKMSGYQTTSYTIKEQLTNGPSPTITMIDGAIDAFSGALFKYPDQVTILIEKE